MVELASIIQVVASATRLSLSLYDFAISSPPATREANRVAKSVSLFALMLKQVGTLLKEDLTSPSSQSYETVQDITLLAQTAFAAVEEVVSGKPQRDAPQDADQSATPPRRKLDLVAQTKLRYLLAYVDSLNSTLSVMLQAFYTVRVIAWSRSRQDRVPASAADAVANERSQLEVLVIEQQLLLLDVSETFAEYRRSRDFAGSPSSSGHSDQRDFAIEQDQTPSPTTLDKYKDQSIKTANPRNSITDSSTLVMNTNSQVPVEKAYTERNGWTEIMQTWVRREAIEEARYSFNQVQKEMPDGSRTRFETCFCIGKALTYVSGQSSYQTRTY
ncbi:hypothetical protein UCRNP2_4039 [Neofusicoccum parvum UCRNP2]|uniref:Fungal N-terminal domain-containing protein n=1 Tax=Botryosphaeria parva (strain UCR-NP2) TaxID=1287680 RepID=R1ENQ8_BOTPV|nr:hypothetical protein UCRNP2_4039 [Neofusicoccum parvum UCRNP2]